MVVAQQVPTSSTMAVPHGPSGVGAARRTVREDLLANGAPDSVVDDAVLILSELLSNSCRHAQPLCADNCVRVSWSRDAQGDLTISVTDGGGPTRPLPATPSITARGGRGLSIITALARDWGVSEEVHEDPATPYTPEGVRESCEAGAVCAVGAACDAREAREARDFSGVRAGYGVGGDGAVGGVGRVAAEDPVGGSELSRMVTVWAVLTAGAEVSGDLATSLGFDLAAIDELH